MTDKAATLLHTIGLAGAHDAAVTCTNWSALLWMTDGIMESPGCGGLSPIPA